jgi:hypothetical protein
VGQCSGGMLGMGLGGGGGVHLVDCGDGGANMFKLLQKKNGGRVLHMFKVLQKNSG